MGVAVLCSFLLLPVQETRTRLALPKSAPMYGIAKISQDGKSMALTVQGNGEVRVQRHQVPVQVQKTVTGDDGKERTVTVVEQRTAKRITLKQRTRPGKGMVTQTYTVMVPSTETRTNKNGETYNVTVMLTEQRTRTIPASSLSIAETGRPTLYKLADSTFFDLWGKPVESAEVARRLRNRRPILVVAEPQLEPYFRALMSQEILLFVPPFLEEEDPANRPQPKK